MAKIATTVIGKGGMGYLFGGIFASPQRTVEYVGRNVSAKDLSASDVIIIATPSAAALEISKLLKKVPGIKDKLVICLWSYMESGEKAFVDLPASLVYIHFLFGPDIENLSGQNVVVTGDYKNKMFTWYMNRLRAKGARVHISTSEEHDKTMAYTQSLSQLSSILLGISLARSGYSRQKLHDFASLTFRLNRHTIERIMKQKAQLWAELQFENKYYPKILDQYLEDLHEMIDAIRAKDEPKFVDLFNAATDFWQEFNPLVVPNVISSKNKRGVADFAALGPAGTYSHEAAVKYAARSSLMLVDSIQDVIRAVDEGKAARGIVPIENSIQGMVVEALDSLYAHKMVIEDELILDINHVLCALERPQRKSGIKVIYSHPQALGQCREYLAREYPGVAQVATVSTAAAMEKISDQKDLSALAIGPEFAAKLNKLSILDRSIQDNPGNQTRFVVFSKKPTIKKPLSFIQIVIIPKVDRTGLLSDILSIIKKEGVNMQHIESRPDRKRLGSYIFYIRLEMASNDKRYNRIVKKLDDIDVKVRRLTA